MSKLFGVTVGWLLGTEDAAPADDLSERQLHMVEELVKKYSQSQSPPPAKKRVWQAVLAGFAVIALLLAGNAALRAGKLQDQLSYQISLLHSRYDGITDQLYHLERTINAVVESERLAARYTLELLAMENTTDLQLQFTAVPGAWEQGDTAWLSLRIENEEKVRAECSFDGNTLAAQVTLPPSAGYDPYLVILHADGSRQQEFLRDTRLLNLKHYTQFQLHWDYHSSTGSSSGVVIRNVRLRLQPPILCPENARWESAELTVCVNGEVKQTFPLFPLGSPDLAQFQVSQPDVLSVEATAGNFHLSVAGLDVREEDLVTIELQGSISSGHSFHQILWTFRKTDNLLQHEP